MSNYNQEGQGKLNQKQQGNKQGTGQDPVLKPGQQAELPDEGNLQQHSPDKRKKNGS